MATNKNQKKRHAITLYGWLLFLLVTALMLTGISLAQYISTTNDKTNSTVASFAVEAVGSGESALVIDCNDPEALSAEYSIQVTNEEKGRLSGTATAYRIVVELPEALPEGVAMTLLHQENAITPSATDGNRYSYTGAAVLPPLKKDTHSYTLRFTVTDPTLIQEALSLSGIRINVIAEQVD